MIASLRGILQSKQPDRVIIDVSGVGYEVYYPQSDLYEFPEVGEELFLFTQMEVREDSMTLYGFRSETEKTLFQMLLSVSGVGPKLALSILSGITPSEFSRAVSSEDIPRLTQLSGVGKKTAERLCLELKEKVTSVFPVEVSVGEIRKPSYDDKDQRIADVLSALSNLGYSPAMAQKAVDAVRRKSKEEGFSAMGIEELLRLALRELA